MPTKLRLRSSLFRVTGFMFGSPQPTLKIGHYASAFDDHVLSDGVYKSCSSVASWRRFPPLTSIRGFLLQAVVECCRILNARIEPIKKKMKSPTWKELIQKCYEEGVDLAARYM